jgi:hypothetical protein
MTTIETTFPPLWIALGVITAVALFILLLRRELRGQTRLVRWSISGLRVALCLLVGWLIAQPRSVSVREETAPLTANLSIDVSESMLLADTDGKTTARWQNGAVASPLDEAITLTEAAKIRLNLSAKQLNISGKKLSEEVQKTLKILVDARQKVDAYGRDASLERLTSAPAAKIAAAEKSLRELDTRQPVVSLVSSAALVAEAALGLRRLEVIKVDKSSANQSADGIPRIDLVTRWLEKSAPSFSRLAGGGDLHTFTFASDLTPLAGDQKPIVSKAGGLQTRLYENLNRMAANDGSLGPQVSFLITDGVDSSPSESGEFSAAVRDHPLIVLAIGDPDTRPDVRVESVVGPTQVREKDTFVTTAQVTAEHSRPVNVTVNLRDQERILASREISLKGDGSSERVELEWQASGLGTKNMTVEVTALPDEKNLLNNSRPLQTTVTKDRYRILVCDAFPRWETRYLQSLFRRDPSVELASLIFEPHHTYPGKTPVETPALPLSLEPWQKFDLVILGDLSPTQLTPAHQKLLVEYVTRGGNLLLLAGENSMPQAFVGAPLESLLPMTRVQPNEIRGTFVIAPPENLPIHPMVRIAKSDTTALWRSIFTATPEYRISPWAKAKQSAQTLLVAKDTASGATHDFLAVQRVGSGRVGFAAAASFYHLRFRFGDRHHLRFWGQMVRGMCMSDFGFGDGMVKTRLDRQLWEQGSEVQGRVRLENREGSPLHQAEFTAVLSRDGQPVARMKPAEDAAKPGEYSLRFPDLPPGDYQLAYEGNQIEPLWNMDRQIQPDSPECRFQILDGALSEERQFAVATPAFWNKVNQLPLGTTIHPQTLSLMLAALDLQPTTLSLNRNHNLWDTWLLLLAIIIVSGIEWLLRRLNGLC